MSKSLRRLKNRSRIGGRPPRSACLSLKSEADCAGDADCLWNASLSKCRKAPAKRISKKTVSNQKKTYPDGRVYDGEWKNGKENGMGKMTWPDGQVYEGEWKKGKMVRGKITWSSGDVYEGNLQNDILEGRGVYRWANGNIYNGSWKNGRITGRGEMTLADGSHYKGIWAIKRVAGPNDRFNYEARLIMTVDIGGKVYPCKWDNGFSCDMTNAIPSGRIVNN